MPKLRCICDNVINLCGIPSENQWMIISDVELDSFEGKIDHDELYQKMEIVVKCPECGRLHVFWDGFRKDQTIYKPENY